MSGFTQPRAGRGPAGWQCGVIELTPAAPAPAKPVVIMKLGGSLLSRSGWPALVAALLADREPGPCRLVVGGGAVVDGLRSLDKVAPQPALLMHDLAIDGMRLTGRLVAETLAVPVVATVDDHAAVAVLDVAAWLAVGQRAAALPHGWDVTSDSIAAWIAVEHGGHLLLAKSVPPPPCPDANGERLPALAAAGWVDAYFPTAAAPLPRIEWAAPAA